MDICHLRVVETSASGRDPERIEYIVENLALFFPQVRPAPLLLLIGGK